MKPVIISYPNKSKYSVVQNIVEANYKNILSKSMIFSDNEENVIKMLGEKVVRLFICIEPTEKYLRTILSYSETQGKKVPVVIQGNLNYLSFNLV